MNFVTRAKTLAYLCNYLPTYRYMHAVRVRFAPSPTGYLHLGGLRTALYNYLFAKKHKGKFILRIEDTDQTRLVSDATTRLIEDLNWSGIVIDEGPTFGGNFGPYIQSQRLSIYNENVQRLLENKAAYRCFCSEIRLDLLRKEALKMRQVPRYDNKCRHLTPSQVDEKLKSNTPFCIRFRMEECSISVHDMIYGNDFANAADNEGDPVIIKSDGFPTYHFANVVDDHLMNVTHVFRGVEWQMSTVKHLLLYKAFGWTPPRYGHLPLLINADGTKLSKRQGDINIKQFRDRNIFPLAVANYVMSAGGGFKREKFSKLAIQTFESLSNEFDIESLNSHPSKLNPDLLSEFNNLEIVRRLSNDQEADQLIEVVRQMVQSKFPQKNPDNLKPTYIRNVLNWSAKRLSTLSDLTSEKFAFLWIDGETTLTDKLTADQILDLTQDLEQIEFTKDNIKNSLKLFSTKVSLKFPDLMKVLRTALSGLKDGPGVAEIMEMIGKEDSLKRIRLNLRSTK